MTDQAGTGKVIFVTGAPFSGKTYLISHLTYEIPSIKIVNFELYCRQKHPYMKFYEHIKNLENESNIVIGESVNNYVGHKHEWCPFKFDDCLNIIVKPPKNQYIANYKEFLSAFGQEAVRKRTSSLGINALYGVSKPPKGKYYIFDGNNLKEIKAVVHNYVNRN